MASEAPGGGSAATSVAGTVPTPAFETVGACVQLTEFMLGSLVLGPCAGGAAWKVIAHLGALPEGRVGALGTEAWMCTISALCFSLHFCSAKAVLSRDSSQPQALQHTAEARERAAAHTLPLPRRSRQVHADLPGNTQACRLW